MLYDGIKLELTYSLPDSEVLTMDRIRYKVPLHRRWLHDRLRAERKEQVYWGIFGSMAPVCAKPVNIGPDGGTSVTQVCAQPATPIVISGGSQDVSTQINAVAPILGHATAKTGSSTTTFIPINGLGVTQSTGSLALASTSNYGQGIAIVRTTGAATGGLGSINYGTTATACGTGGPMVGKMYLDVTRLE